MLIRTQPSSGRPTGMSMRTKNTRSFSLPSHRPIEIAINEKAGASLEGCVFHCVPLVGTLLTDNGVKRSTLGQRIQLGSDKDLPANRGRSFLPFLQVGMSRRHPHELGDRFGFGVVMATAKDGFLSYGQGRKQEKRCANEGFHTNTIGRFRESGQPLAKVVLALTL